jgi:hypothetical protein
MSIAKIACRYLVDVEERARTGKTNFDVAWEDPFREPVGTEESVRRRNRDEEANKYMGVQGAVATAVVAALVMKVSDAARDQIDMSNE